MDWTLIFGGILFVAWLAIQVYIRVKPNTHILSDFSKLVASQQYEQAAYYLKHSDKKHLARELKGIMKDAKKKDLKGYCNTECSQKCRYRFAYELYLVFIGELKMKTDYLDQCKLDEERSCILDRIKASRYV
jgi:hypothetical protein